MAKRGFTLLEVLIALGVLVALGALVSASLVGFAGEVRFDEGVRRIGAALVLARADAQREGRALSVVALEGDHGVTLAVEPFEAEAAGREEGEFETRRATEGHGAERRRLAMLPGGVRISSQAPEEESGKWIRRGGESGNAADTGAENAVGGAERPAAVRVCVMLPDGSAWASRPVYLVADSRAARIVVNRWTGAARAEPVEPASDEESGINTPASNVEEERAR